MRVLFLYPVYQGLGLLINLVEYSSRNRHCLVDMEYKVDDTCLEDSLMQPADPTQPDTAASSAMAPPSTAEIQGDGADKPKSSGALAALVQVGTVPGLINKYFSRHRGVLFCLGLQGCFEVRMWAETVWGPLMRKNRCFHTWKKTLYCMNRWTSDSPLFVGRQLKHHPEALNMDDGVLPYHHFKHPLCATLH